MRILKLVAVFALVGGTGLAAGCSASGANHSAPQAAAPSTATPARPVPAPQLTVAGASQAFAAFLPKFNEMVTTDNTSMISRLTTGPETAVRAAAMSPAATSSAALLQPLAHETFYVPRTQFYPRWFAVVGKTTSGTGLVMLMIQTGPGAPWREAEHFTDLQTDASTGQPDDAGAMLPALPAVSVTPQGYALPIAQDTTAVPGFTQDLTMTPGQVPAGYAAFLNGTATPSFMSGPMTSGWLAADRQADADASAVGWVVRQAYQPSSYPVYTLRTDDGCTLTFFSVKETETWTRAGAKAPAMTKRYMLEELAIQPIHGDDDETGVKMIPAQGGGLVS